MNLFLIHAQNVLIIICFRQISLYVKQNVCGMNAKLKILQIALKQQFPIALLAVIMEINAT